MGKAAKIFGFCLLVGAVMVAVLGYIHAPLKVYGQYESWTPAGYSDYGRVEYYRQGNYEKAVISGLYKYTKYGEPIDSTWYYNAGRYVNGNNFYSATVDLSGVAIDSENGSLSYSPTLTVGEKEYQPAKINLLNSNELVIDYGVIKRHLKTIPGGLTGWWENGSDITENVTIKYNQSGDYRLELGRFAVDNDTEKIEPADFEDLRKLNDGRLYIGDSLTFNPDGNPESNTVDGQVTRTADSSWATMHDATSGDGGSDSDTYMRAIAQCAPAPATNTWSFIGRVFALFDTAAIPDDAIITSANLSIRGNNVADTWGTAELAVYSSNPASDTSLSTADYDQLGTTAFSDYIDSGSFSTSGYNEFTLNANGINAINKTGITKLGLRVVWDADDNPPAWGSEYDATFKMYAAEGGAGYEPILEVTYSLLPPGAPTGLTITQIGVSDVNVSWTDNASAAYSIVRMSYGGAWWTSYNGTAETANFTGLDLNSTIYYIGVYSFNGGGMSTGVFGSIGGDGSMELSLSGENLLLFFALGLLAISIFYRKLFMYMGLFVTWLGVIVTISDVYINITAGIIMLWSVLQFIKIRHKEDLV